MRQSQLRSRNVLLALTVWVAPPLANAAEAPCRVGDRSLFCRLHGILSLLSVTAVVLGTLLLLALLAAFWYYRRNRNKDLLPR